MTLRLGSEPSDQPRRRRYNVRGLRVSLRSVRGSVNLTPKKPPKN